MWGKESGDRTSPTPPGRQPTETGEVSGAGATLANTADSPILQKFPEKFQLLFCSKVCIYIFLLNFIYFFHILCIQICHKTIFLKIHYLSWIIIYSFSFSGSIFFSTTKSLHFRAQEQYHCQQYHLRTPWLYQIFRWVFSTEFWLQCYSKVLKVSSQQKLPMSNLLFCWFLSWLSNLFGLHRQLSVLLLEKNIRIKWFKLK